MIILLSINVVLDLQPGVAGNPGEAPTPFNGIGRIAYPIILTQKRRQLKKRLSKSRRQHIKYCLP